MAKKIAIIGAGIYGCQIALTLNQQGFDVVLYEKNGMILSEISGNFGIRLHEGLHYPRSSKTRKSCLRGRQEFEATYPELVNKHDHSLYGLSNTDASNSPSKVTPEQFKKLASESKDFEIVEDVSKFGYTNLATAIDTKEPTLVLGSKLRKGFNSRLQDNKIDLRLNAKITQIDKTENDQFLIRTDKGEEAIFDEVVNATSYKQFLPEDPLPFDMRIVYQACTALVYEDLQEKELGKARPFIVMDGWFPCFMPYDDSESADPNKNSTYIVTHGSYTIIGTRDTEKETSDFLEKTLADQARVKEVRDNSEKHLCEFWPEFKERFKYIKWIGTVLAKIVSDTEFRSAITFKAKNGMIYIIPGKLNNIFDIAREVNHLINNQPPNPIILSEGGFQYVNGGLLDEGRDEILKKPEDTSRNTCFLQSKESASIIQKGVSFFNVPSNEEKSTPLKINANPKKWASPFFDEENIAVGYNGPTVPLPAISRGQN
jgi:glycine/D-amino acid oxidase-like deaminating enzyme